MVEKERNRILLERNCPLQDAMEIMDQMRLKRKKFLIM
jgi:hypothetical protein